MPIHYDVQRDEDSGRWFFIVFTAPDEDVYESEPGFDSEEDADEAAVRWIAENLLGPADGD